MLRIASYNIRKSVGLDWKREPARIQAILQEIDADIVILQEADKRFNTRAGTLSLESLGRELNYGLVDIATHPNSHGWHGNAILYKSNITLLASHRIDLPRKEPRGAISATFVLQTNQRIKVIGTHLSLLKKTRKRQIQHLLSMTEKQEVPTVLGGDLNERGAENWISDESFSSFQLVTPGPSFHSKRPLFCLDRFIVSDKLRVKESYVHHSNLAARASDHLPIVIDINIENTA